MVGLFLVQPFGIGQGLQLINNEMSKNSKENQLPSSVCSISKSKNKHFVFIFVSNRFFLLATFGKWKIPRALNICNPVKTTARIKNLSKQEHANLANLAKITIQRIENAKYVITIDTLISLSHGLNLPLRELADLRVPKKKVNDYQRTMVQMNVYVKH